MRVKTTERCNEIGFSRAVRENVEIIIWNEMNEKYTI